MILIVVYTKHFFFMRETILFETSNTCVWHVKQYCLTSETILFGPSMYEKEKNETKILTSALQKEREHATFATIKSYPTGSLIFSESYCSRHSSSPGATIFHQTPTMCILRIAPEGHFCSSTRLRVQGSPFSNDSFDVLTLCQSGEKETEYLPECCIFAWRFQDILRTLQNLKETYD